MRISVTSVMVDDQVKALKFYTEVLGFVTKMDIPAGDFRWLTVVSPEGSADVELLLEPNNHPAAQAFQKAIYADGIPATAFESADVLAEYQRLKKLGVVFRSEPTKAGPTTVVTFEDTCGNLIQLYQTITES
jgi:catechol 2,3-dioxygenase-like lactoylglutathione lyase family enzyme